MSRALLQQSPRQSDVDGSSPAYTARRPSTFADVDGSSPAYTARRPSTFADVDGSSPAYTARRPSTFADVDGSSPAYTARRPSTFADVDGSSPAYTARRPSTFATQANALMRKNATLQMRNKGTNLRLLLQPVVLCVLLKLGQNLFESIGRPDVVVDCSENGLFMSMMMGAGPDTCPIPRPPKWPVLLQVPEPEFRAVRNGFYQDLPVAACRKDGDCPVSMLITGENRPLAQGLANKLLGGKPFRGGDAALDPFTVASSNAIGTEEIPAATNFFESGFAEGAKPLYIVQQNCAKISGFPLAVPVLKAGATQDVECLESLQLWRDSSSEINKELFTGFRGGNSQGEINEFLAAYDFLNTDEKHFNVSVWYNGSYGANSLARILRATNAASNSYLQSYKNHRVEVLLEYVKEMPKGLSGRPKVDIVNLVVPLFFTWVIQLLLPVMLEYLVYEKQKKLRTIMKMHGLGDGAYWIITYTYFLFISFFYILSLVLFGSLLGLKSFTLNDYSVQFLFFFIQINLQIGFAFFLSVFFSDVKTVTVVGYLYVFGSGLMGMFLFQKLIENPTFSKLSLKIIETVPAFSLYRGLYEFGQSASEVDSFGMPIMTLSDVFKDAQGLQSVFKLMIVEWVILLLSGCYLDQVVTNGGVSKHPLWFLPCFNGKSTGKIGIQEHSVGINMEKSDVAAERDLVDRLVEAAQTSQYVLICRDVKKVYPPTDGNPEKHAVRGLSLALPAGECFGMIGPNGAGKTSFINMMTGFTIPTSGTAFVQGLDISKDMNEVYTSMGVCPQDNLIWEKLSGSEHLLFYGRLKNLEGTSLLQAVEESLKRVNLLEKGATVAGAYSGGMKRRLSVAISLIGNPRVVYLDEPSTGLDPASRNNLWNVVQNAKKDKAIILTTHSMEEAEYLCDRVGIFVDGTLQCIGNPKELKARYGGYYVFAITTPLEQEEEAEKLVHRLSRKAKKLYHISGTQKYQLPKEDVKLADVFREVANAKNVLSIQAWGLSDATLEDVFIKVAREIPSVEEL